MRIALMISNMGGPDSLDAVEPYLRNIFSDPDIIDIPLPGPIRKRFASWLAGRRAPESRDIYRRIGGRSPLLEITSDQARRLEEKLNGGDGPRYEVMPAMRYWHPLVENVWERIRSGGFDKAVVLSLYPFYSSTTGGSLVNLIGRLNETDGFASGDLCVIDRFGAYPAYLDAMERQIRRFLADSPLAARDEINLLFSAHSIPVRRVKRGDPYRDEIGHAVDALRGRLPGKVRVHLSFQSKIGPVKWLEPSTPDKIRELARRGVRELVVYPLGFVADNSETLYELDILYRDYAREQGIDRFFRIEALNSSDDFVDSLASLVNESCGATVR
jgi:ferrochelatase